MKNLPPSFSQKAGRIMLTTLSVLLAAILISTGTLLILSPGKPLPLLGENGKLLDGGISEKVYVEINGVDQGMVIQSKNIENPVLLFVHGGPGMPEYWLTQRYPTGLEDYFTVVWWDQRGAGLSYNSDIPSGTMTVEQYIADTLEVTRYLLKRFDQEKIYLLGHSWGSFIGIQAAAQAPELYYAYIGMGQISNQLLSEQLAYQYALTYFNEIGNSSMVSKLEAAPPAITVPLSTNYEALRDVYMHEAGIGTTHEMKSVITGIFLPSLAFRGYTVSEKINLWRGKIYSRTNDFGLWQTMLTTDLTQQVTKLDIPIYFFHGQYDYTCAYPLAKTYYEQIQAPLKGFYTFEKSAHSPLFEEPEKALEVLLVDVLAGSTSLADK